MPVTNGVCLIDGLGEINDPRKPSNETLPDFQEILVISIAAMLSDYHVEIQAKAVAEQQLQEKNRIEREVKSLIAAMVKAPTSVQFRNTTARAKQATLPACRCNEHKGLTTPFFPGW